MELYQTRKFLPRKGSYKQNEKVIYWMGEDLQMVYLTQG